MKGSIMGLALLLALGASPAAAQEPHPRLGLGFRSTRAPLGVRWWYSPDAALDANVGFQSTVDFEGLRLNQYVLQAGFPFALHRWPRLSAELRPGFEYALEQQDAFQARRVTDHFLQADLKLEAEVFVLDRLSISGSFGFGMARRKLGSTGETQTSWALTGANFSDVGFHLYLGAPR